MEIGTVVAVIIAVIAILAAFLMYVQKERSRKLRTKFGPEYDRLLEREHGSARRAEALLEDREKRVSKLSIRPLTQQERDRFAGEWRIVQEKFVDDPRLAVAQADTLVNQALRSRGYPMADFEQRAADISVQNPEVVENYRIAHDVAQRDSRGLASTEDLRRAMQHYRHLFEGVLGTHVTVHEVQL
jgi:FtsZ-interacting cell division protein ZipA